MLCRRRSSAVSAALSGRSATHLQRNRMFCRMKIEKAKGVLDMELSYRQNGDYLIPDIEMDEQPTESIGKYGMMRKTFLKAHRSGMYNALLLQNKLTARDFVKTKTGTGGSMNIQESEEFKTTKFFCKTDFDMREIKAEEAAYVPLPKFYTFKSREERERILYKNFIQVGQDVKDMIADVLNKRGAK